MTDLAAILGGYDNFHAHRRRRVEALARAGWRVAVAVDAATGLAVIADGRPALILLDPALPGPGGTALLPAIRGGAGGAVPVIALADGETAAVGPWQRDGYDDVLARSCSDAALVAMARRWREAGLPPATRRLARTFGDAAIARMLDGLAVQLATAIAAIDRGEAAGIAHQIAGTAGTLGFAELGAAWLALSHGDDSMRQPARRAARRTIATLARRPPSSAPH